MQPRTRRNGGAGPAGDRGTKRVVVVIVVVVRDGARLTDSALPAIPVDGRGGQPGSRQGGHGAPWPVPGKPAPAAASRHARSRGHGARRALGARQALDLRSSPSDQGLCGTSLKGALVRLYSILDTLSHTLDLSKERREY
eukprot:scaffold64111_cov69-Phaeocystis_antarctica.AAC.4